MPFYPATVEVGYFTWSLLPELFPVSFPGVKTSRDDVLVEIDRDKLEARLRLYFDPSKSDDEIAALAPRLMESTSRFDARATRAYLLGRGFLPENIVRYCYRPYDVRWLYWEPETALLDRNRAEYVPHVFDGNVWLEARQKQSKEGFDRGYIVSVLADNFGSGLSSFFPLYLRSWPDAGSLFSAQGDIRPNLANEASQYLDELEARETDLFYHAVALLHSPAYRRENANALRQDWPRIPLPDNADLLRTSAKLGRTIAVLLDGDEPIPDDLPDFILDILSGIAVPQRVGGGQLDPDNDLNITVNWGYLGQAGATMPGRGKTEVHPVSSPYRILGETSFDVFLNDSAYWGNIPVQVWNYTLGGYQVIKKWLSYRETDILGRPLRIEEVRMVQGIAQRIAAILLLGPQLDENYELVKRNLRVLDSAGG